MHIHLRCYGCALLLLLLSAGVVLPAYSAITDGVVATVGGVPILHSDIMQEIMPEVMNLSASAVSQEDLEKQIEPLFRETLEQAIEHYILYREAQSMGIKVPDDEVEKRVSEFRKMYESSEAYQNALAGAGYTMSDFRDRMRRQMMAVTVSITKRRQFEREAVVTESDIAQYYHDNIDEYRFTARYRIRRIFMTAPQAPDGRREVAENLDALRARILSGADFAELAREHSEGPEAQEGGLMGWIRPDDLVSPLSEAVASLTPGDLSDILESEFGVHLLRIEEVENEGVIPFNEARTEIEPILRSKRGDERYRQWMGTLRQRSNVRVFL